MDAHKIPLLKVIFERNPPRGLDHPAEPPLITLGNLARALNVGVDRIEPLAREGWLKLHSAGPLTSQSYVESPPEKALRWLRQWFQPVMAKPLFSQQDMADLLGVRLSEVLGIAAAHDIPTLYDPALGHLWSMWAAKAMLTRVLSGGVEEAGQRFDRQSFLWNLLGGDPARVAELPRFDEQLEVEIERVASLDEPQRSLRSASLLDHFRDAAKIIDSASAEHSPSEPSQPAPLASESMEIASESLRQACEREFSRLT